MTDVTSRTPTMTLTAPPSLAALVPAWRAQRLGSGYRPRGVEAYETQVTTFLSWIGPEPTIADLTHAAIAEYQASLAGRWGPLTISQALSAIRAFVRWQIDRGYRADDPTRGITWPKRPKRVPRALTTAQVRALWAAISEPAGLDREASWQWRRERRIVMLMLYAGLRRVEVAALLWRDVDLGSRPGEGSITVRDGKGGKDRVIPLHPTLRAELLAVELRPARSAVAGRRDGKRLTTKSIGHTFERWLPARGITTSAHVLRHTFATELIRNKADIRKIQELLGHESLETTEVYLAADPEQLREAVQMLPEGYGAEE
jgi:integrase/recombinase XerD